MNLNYCSCHEYDPNFILNVLVNIFSNICFDCAYLVSYLFQSYDLIKYCSKIFQNQLKQNNENGCLREGKKREWLLNFGNFGVG